MRALVTAGRMRTSDSFWRAFVLALGSSAAAAALSLAGSQAALAVKSPPPPTLQCTDKCQGCMEAEVLPDGTERCVKCGVLPMCLGSEGPMWYDEATNLLNAHNELRARHGDCRRSETGTISCSPTPPLTWSADLAKSAQTWADTCPLQDPSNPDAGFIHSKAGETRLANTGENIHGAGSKWTSDRNGNRTYEAPDVYSESTRAVRSWYDEIKNYDFNDPEGSWARGQNDRNKQVGHFTQLVWKDTKEVGCGVKQCPVAGRPPGDPGVQVWVCQYGPPGNWTKDKDGRVADKEKFDANVQRTLKLPPPDRLKLFMSRLPTPQVAPIPPPVVTRYSVRKPMPLPEVNHYPEPMPIPPPSMVNRYPDGKRLPLPEVTRYPVPKPPPVPPNPDPTPMRLPEVTRYPVPKPVPPPGATRYPDPIPMPPPVATRYPVPKTMPPPVPTRYSVPKPQVVTRYPVTPPVSTPQMVKRYPVPRVVPTSGPHLTALRAKPAVKYMQRARQHPLTYIKPANATNSKQAMSRRYRKH